MLLPLVHSVDDGDGRRRRRAAGVHSRCERPRPARPFTCVPSHACSHCPSKRAALYPIRLHSPLPYVCESIHALHPFTMRMAAARTCLHSSSFYACESTHARGCLFDPCALTAFLCMRSDPSPPPVRPLASALLLRQLGLGFPDPIMAVVVCIRLCQNPRSTSMQACR